ncbi:N-acetylmuramoyl-L-alanine amidase [Halorhodospira abdelmalekii]|uniref:N-acetylmuramoyl-L-alanine amidase n=1 Tax=Halorhodospira abdelmalekii TaxID=421629 RepID=UPI0019032846|nr:N-acetylmuramoyl-L-alanine amidase [Halorhodospira abdelmalekii]
MATFALLGLFVLPGGVWAAAAGLQGVEIEAESQRLRIVFDLDAEVEHKLFALREPERVVIDFPQTELRTDQLPAASGLLRGVRSGMQEGGVLRIVLDLERSVDSRSFVVGPGGSDGQRVVVDLTPRQGGEVEQSASQAQSADATEQRPAQRRSQPVRSAAERQRQRAVVAIDAGHGGVDPGAIGPGGSYEKDVVLAVARKLEALMKEEPNLKPLMIREGDYFMPLRDRTRKARRHNADLFISLHADGAENPNVKGASVYALSLDGATSERARMLAQRENAADFIGGVSLEDKDENLRSVLLDLSRGHTIEASLAMGDYMLSELDRHADLLRNRVDQAGFAVLKSLDMPSLLVELGFMTNAEEERRLNDPDYQRALADGVLAAVRRYAENYILPEMRRIAAEEGGNGVREHEVRRGENLSVIARRYDVTPEALRQANNLSSDRIRAGSTLVIP